MNMRPIIMKFGGTSVADEDAFKRVRQIVRAHRDARPVVVLSAMSRVTDALLTSVQVAANGSVETARRALDEHFERHRKVARALLTAEAAKSYELVLERAQGEIAELLREVSARSQPLPLLQDVVVSYGERLSASLLAEILRADDLAAQYVDARRCVTTDNEHGCAAPLFDETIKRTRAEALPLVEKSVIPVLGGFIASSLNGETTTLGRGGSDYTAAIIGAALSAREIQIWTDVPGVLTADPRIVHAARTIPRLSYAEAAELAYFGAKVLHPKTIQPAIEQNIPVRICNSRAADSRSTLVCAETETSPHTVKAIAHKTGVTTIQVTSARMLGAYGFLRSIFDIFDRHRTVVDVVTTSEVSVSLSLDNTNDLSAIIAELETLGSVNIETERAIVCVVGEGLRGTPGIAARVFSLIGNINISLISQGASQINLTFAIDEDRVAEAVERLHNGLFEQHEEVSTACGSGRV
ncbi:MAG: aspartate kinase [Acidobacteriota bacterium]|jgi:aspartate kinase|nr:aspartate kinase [Acidobacteriota bacterium]